MSCALQRSKSGKQIPQMYQLLLTFPRPVQGAEGNLPVSGQIVPASRCIQMFDRHSDSLIDGTRNLDLHLTQSRLRAFVQYRFFTPHSLAEEV